MGVYRKFSFVFGLKSYISSDFGGGLNPQAPFRYANGLSCVTSKKINQNPLVECISINPWETQVQYHKPYEQRAWKAPISLKQIYCLRNVYHFNFFSPRLHLIDWSNFNRDSLFVRDNTIAEALRRAIWAIENPNITVNGLLLFVWHGIVCDIYVLWDANHLAVYTTTIPFSLLSF